VAVTGNADVSDVLRFVVFHRVIPRFDWDLIMRGVEENQEVSNLVTRHLGELLGSALRPTPDRLLKLRPGAPNTVTLSYGFVLPLPELPLPYHVFISHPWEGNDNYDRVVSLLCSDPGFYWENVSIPKERPLALSGNLPRSYRTIAPVGRKDLESRLSASSRGNVRGVPRMDSVRD
jgi:hypothetical protein